MRLLQLNDVSLTLPGRTLLNTVTWSVFRGERYGLIGPNGAGKTTLLKIMLGSVVPSSGEIHRLRDLSVGFLPQEGLNHQGKNLFDEVWSGLPQLPGIESELSRLRSYVADSPSDSDAIERMGVLQHRWEDLEGYHAEAKVARVLAGLGFKERDHRRQVDEFSGGWQMRIALAKLLLFDPDLLLLDEPTNHLDLPALLWLENYLREFHGSLILVSHDRMFLDRIVGRIAEIENSRLAIYDGNFSNYETIKAERLAQHEAEAERVAEERKRIERFVERFRYKASKARQVQSRVKMLEKMAPIEGKSTGKRVRFKFPSAPQSGKIVLELANVEKSYGNVHVFSHVELVLMRGEKLALVGANGAGKSTLCRLISGVESPSNGMVKLGHNVKVDYFAQEANFHLDRERTVLEEMESEVRDLTQTALRGLLGAFLFSGDDVFKKVSVLSGGEKSRLALAKMLLRPSNLLILDEPTNHLDMSSQDVLLDALIDYGGTLIVVSHDRHFLDRLVSRVLELEDGRLGDWPGTLSEYLEKRGLNEKDVPESSQVSQRIPVTISESPAFKSRNRKQLEADVRNRFSRILRDSRREVENLQRRIEESEKRIAEIESVLADEELYRDPEKCRILLPEYERLRRELPLLIEEWERAEMQVENLERERQEELQTRIRQSG